jgi:hypothetical protein
VQVKVKEVLLEEVEEGEGEEEGQAQAKQE